MCVPEQDREEHTDHQIDAATSDTGVKPQNFKVQVLQGMLSIIFSVYQLHSLKHKVSFLFTNILTSSALTSSSLCLGA